MLEGKSETTETEETQPEQLVTIILTTTVFPDLKKLIFQSNPAERIATYVKSFAQWIQMTNFRIVIVENTGYEFQEIQSMTTNSDRIEFISLNNNLLESYSKGETELISINYAFTHSKLLQNSDFIVKITGRFFVPGLVEYLRNIDVTQFEALRQFEGDRCEMVGARKDHFHIIFSQSLLDDNAQYCGHVETLYQQRIAKCKSVLVCPKFEIQPTQRGGEDQIYTYI